jgi:hypothetical protein
MLRLYPLFLLLILTACQAGPYPPDSPLYTIPAGSHIIIRQPLTIPANKATSYLQYGKPVSYAQVDQYYPHCWLTSWKVLNKSQTIKPGIFIVTRVLKYDDLVSLEGKVQVASNNNLTSGRITGGGPTASEYKTELIINSDAQPDIRRLICSHWGDPSFGEHLTVNQMQAALGGFVHLELKK